EKLVDDAQSSSFKGQTTLDGAESHGKVVEKCEFITSIPLHNVYLLILYRDPNMSRTAANNYFAANTSFEANTYFEAIIFTTSNSTATVSINFSTTTGYYTESP